VEKVALVIKITWDRSPLNPYDGLMENFFTELRKRIDALTTRMAKSGNIIYRIDLAS